VFEARGFGLLVFGLDERVEGCAGKGDGNGIGLRRWRSLGRAEMALQARNKGRVR